MKLIVKSTILIFGLLATTAVQAANAIVTTNLNLRTGPGTRYPSLGSVPNRAGVDVRGCTAGYNWCQVGYRGVYGWASSRYLATLVDSRGGYSNNFGNSAASIGIPLIAGALIGSAIANNRNDRWDRRDGYNNWGRRDGYNNWGRRGGNNNWGHREGPGYRPGWNRGGVGIGNGVRPNRSNYYNPYSN